MPNPGLQTSLNDVCSPKNAHGHPGGKLRSEVWDNGGVVAISASTAWRTPMGNKDKGGKNTKTVAAKNLKEKRIDKKEKRTAAEAKRNRAVK